MVAVWNAALHEYVFICKSSCRCIYGVSMHTHLRTIFCFVQHTHSCIHACISERVDLNSMKHPRAYIYAHLFLCKYVHVYTNSCRYLDGVVTKAKPPKDRLEDGITDHLDIRSFHKCTCKAYPLIDQSIKQSINQPINHSFNQDCDLMCNPYSKSKVALTMSQYSYSIHTVFAQSSHLIRTTFTPYSHVNANQRIT